MMEAQVLAFFGQTASASAVWALPQLSLETGMDTGCRRGMTKLLPMKRTGEDRR